MITIFRVVLWLRIRPYRMIVLLYLFRKIEVIRMAL
jgi:hypothetical protein